MANASTSVTAELERLVALRDRGALTAEEFAEQKARTLGSRGKSSPVDGIDDVWVYALIALPLVAFALAVAASSGGPLPPVAVVIFVFANTAFTLFDAAKLDTAGMALQPWQFIPGFLFSPLYLLFRARRLGRGFGYLGAYLGVLLVIVALPWVLPLLVR